MILYGYNTTAIVNAVKIYFPNKLNLKPIIELDNENYFTNQRFLYLRTIKTIYIHTHFSWRDSIMGCNLRYYEQFKSFMTY